MRHRLIGASLSFALVSACAVLLYAQPPAATTPPSELDAFMAKVLARRDVNRQTLQQYILDDLETFEVLGPGRTPLHRGKREFSWYVRDGMHVRSPVRFDGVTVGEADRRKYEDDWIHRERERQARADQTMSHGDPPGAGWQAWPLRRKLVPQGCLRGPRSSITRQSGLKRHQGSWRIDAKCPTRSV